MNCFRVYGATAYTIYYLIPTSLTESTYALRVQGAKFNIEGLNI